MATQAASAVGEHPYVGQRPDAQGGRPVIKESRFPVSPIVQDYRRGWSVEEILREFPQLRPAEVHTALSYYYNYQAEIDREVAELMDLDAAMQKYPPTLPSLTVISALLGFLYSY